MHKPPPLRPPPIAGSFNFRHLEVDVVKLEATSRQKEHYLYRCTRQPYVPWHIMMISGYDDWITRILPI